MRHMLRCEILRKHCVSSRFRTPLFWQLAADVMAVQPFGAAPVVAPAGGRGRGRGRGAAAVGVPIPVGAVGGGPPELRFIALATLDTLVDYSSPLPLLSLSVLAGFLGPCSNQAVRADELSVVRIIALILRSNLASSIGLDAAASINPASDPLLAMRVGSFSVSAFQSLDVFVAPLLIMHAIQHETLSALRYLLGSEQERIVVESQNIRLVDDR